MDTEAWTGGSMSPGNSLFNWPPVLLSTALDAKINQ